MVVDTVVDDEKVVGLYEEKGSGRGAGANVLMQILEIFSVFGERKKGRYIFLPGRALDVRKADSTYFRKHVFVYKMSPSFLGGGAFAFTTFDETAIL